MTAARILERVRLIPIYLLFLYTWFLTGFGKLLGSGVPESFANDFGGTFLASFPGLTVAFYQIALLEVGAGLLFVVSLLKGEFLPNRERPFLQLGLSASLLTFAVLGFGMRLINNHAGAASLFFYFGAVAAIWALVELLGKQRG